MPRCHRFQDWVCYGMPAGVARVKGVLAFDEDRLTRFALPVLAPFRCRVAPTSPSSAAARTDSTATRNDI